MKPSLQTIHNKAGIPEYILLPIEVYQALKNIDTKHSQLLNAHHYTSFNPADFLKNPVALMRMQAKIKQTELAKHLKVSQAYISKIENDDYVVSEKLLAKVKKIISKIKRGN